MQLQQPERSCHLQLFNLPDNGGTMPSKNFIFITHVDPISPQNMFGGGAGYRPGPISLLYKAFITIVLKTIYHISSNKFIKEQ